MNPTNFTMSITHEFTPALTRLERLLDNLPHGLPIDPPESRYHAIGLDTDDVAEEGEWYALNRNLEICFNSQGRDNLHPILGRSPQFKHLIEIIQRTANVVPTELAGVLNWIRRISQAAIEAGSIDPSERSSR